MRLLLALTAVLVAACTPTPDESGLRGAAPTGAETVEPAPSGPAETTPPSAAEQQRLDERLLAAAWANDVPRARALIEKGADVNWKDETQQSAYLVATSEGYLDLLELVLRNGAKVDDKDSFDGTGLIRAAERGHAAVVGRLVRAGISLDHVNRLGWTALHEAVILGDGTERYVDTVRVLVAAGVDVDIPARRDGLTALQHAEAAGQTEVAHVLRSAADHVREPRRTLLSAAEQGDADRVALALRAGADVESRDEHLRSPLLLAATFDRVDVARLLVYLGGDPDALDDRHDTPWLVTGVTGSVAMAEVLLAADPDLSIRNRYGGVSIIPASERGHVDYVRRVVRTDIDVNHVNDLGWTALLEAVILGQGTERWQQIVAILLDSGADPSIADNDGATALEHARSRGYDEIARLLSGR